MTQERSLKWIKDYKTTDWIYRNDMPDNKGLGNARFVLGIKGIKTLVCFGINPSTAWHDKPDPTMQRVEKYADKHGYDSFIMLNVYPQRTPNPNEIDRNLNVELHKRNLKEIEEILKCENLTIWAAWGKNINKRPFLINCLNDINKIVVENRHKWFCLNVPESEFPVHPLFHSKKGFKLYETNLTEYTIKTPVLV
jgi:hypothetical protein